MRRALLWFARGSGGWPWVFAQSSRPAILSRLIWFDRTGQRLGALGPVADHGNLELSPTALASPSPSPIATRATRDIWFYTVASGERTQFTSDPADENWLIWSPDGARVLLNSFTRDRLSLLEAQSTGAAERLWLLEGDEGKWPVSWSPDGRYVLYVTNNDRTSNDIWVLLRDGTGSPYPYLHTAASENWAAFSPDGTLGGLQCDRVRSARSVRCAVSRRRCGAGASRRTAARKRDGVAMGRRSSTSRRTGC